MPWYTTADARRDAEKQAAAKIDQLQNPGVQGLAQLGRNAIERVAQLESEIERLTKCLERANAQAEKFEREWYLRGDVLDNTEYWLGSLLAVIHRDGGHYQAEHGTKKASDDAQQRVRATHGTADELAMLVRRLAHALQKAAPDNNLPKTAMDYLSIAGFAGSPMRGTE